MVRLWLLMEDTFYMQVLRFRRHRFWISRYGVLVYHSPLRSCIGYFQSVCEKINQIN